ncbi:MAG: MazG nucleotide pyrophosphohydrolase domain-containing protein [Deinococcota bacterium]
MSEMQTLQQRIAAQRAQRGFVTDPLKIHILLTEEVGEVAKELKRTWSKNYDDFNQSQLADEIADVFVLLSALASSFEIDIASAVETKFFEKDADRTWNTAKTEAPTDSRSSH